LLKEGLCYAPAQEEERVKVGSVTRRRIEGKKGDAVESKGLQELMRELDRQGNAIEARKATAVATLVTLVTKRKRKGDRQRQTATRVTRATDFDR
jgi:hypothetical protein